MPKLNSRRVDLLLEDVVGCRWTITVLRAVAGGVTRPGALERHLESAPFLPADCAKAQKLIGHIHLTGLRQR
jgi:hypothetical protein